MELYFVSIALAVVANVAYHLCMKVTPAGIHPLVSLLVTYGVAMVTTLVLIPVFVGSGWTGQARLMNWAPVLLGVSIVGLEVGFILAYRAGWNLNNAAVVCNVAVGILLIPIGVIFFKEGLSPTRALGIAFALAGLYLLSRK